MLACYWFWFSMILSTSIPVNAKRFKRSPILGGDVAQPNEFQYAVAILSFKTGYTCTGGIISEKHILSAAHCFTNNSNWFKKDSFVVFAGTTNHELALEDPSSIGILVKTIFVPSDYDYKIRKADISILELTEDLMIQKNRLQILTLPFRCRNFEVGERAVVAAFGACGINVSLNGTKKIVDSLVNDGKLLSATIEIINKDECHAVPYGNFSIGHYHLLGKMIKHSNEIYGMCYGDSGSSLVDKSKVVFGVMVDAFDEGCDGRTLPVIFTKVRSYLPFIRNVMSGRITNLIRVKNLV